MMPAVAMRNVKCASIVARGKYVPGKRRIDKVVSRHQDEIIIQQKMIELAQASE